MKAIAASRKTLATRVLWLIEMVVIVLAVMVAARLRFIDSPEGYAQFFADSPLRVLLVALVITTAMAAFGLYQVHVRHNRVEFAVRLVLAFAFGGIGLLVIYYLVPQTYVGRSVLAIALVLGFFAVATVRLLRVRLFGTKAFKRRVLVFGAGRNANLINRRMRRNADRHSFVVVGFVPVEDQPAEVPEALQLRTSSNLPELTEALHVDEIVVAPDERRGGLPMDSMLACAQRGIVVSDLSTFFEREAGMVSLDVSDPSWLVFCGGFDHSMPRRLSKRFFDLLAASALLLVAWPFMLLVALAIWLECGTPILYRQTRVGERGLTFDLVKFRSMRVDAESDGIARWATREDDRTTRIGRFIRKTRLDELPQLFNVLRGDMSFVGPRPERPQFVEMLTREIRYYNVRHSVKPGLTGWAQLRYAYGASVQDAEEKLTFDLFYVKNQGLVFDLMILLQTVEVVLFRRGGRSPPATRRAESAGRSREAGGDIGQQLLALFFEEEVTSVEHPHPAITAGFVSPPLQGFDRSDGVLVAGEHRQRAVQRCRPRMAIRVQQAQVGTQYRQGKFAYLRMRQAGCERAEAAVERLQHVIVRQCQQRRVGGLRGVPGPGSSGHEQMGRLPGLLALHPVRQVQPDDGPEAVAEDRGRRGWQWCDCIGQCRHHGWPGLQRRFTNAVLASWKLHRIRFDVGRQQFGPAAKGKRSAAGVRDAQEAPRRHRACRQAFQVDGRHRASAGYPLDSLSGP